MNSSQVDCPPVLTIGPTVPSIYLDNRIHDDQQYDVDLFKLEAPTSMNWLKTKPPGSVVYVAFGSMVNFSPKQTEELAWGFKGTNYYYLWVIRDDDQWPAPELLESWGDRLLVVNWSPQVEVLATEAVGCFFTHCGWNSTIEALSLGVPMVGMPQWTDQPPNAKLVEDVWKAGVRVKVDENGIVSREEVEARIREVMESERGKEMKINCNKWKKLAVEAVSHGGTSDVNVDQFVSYLMANNLSKDN